MAAIAGRRDGESVYLSWIYYEDNCGCANAPIRVTASVREATVFNAERGLIDQGAHSTPRAVGIGEILHDSPREAWMACAEDCRRAAAMLTAKAAECEAIAVAASARVA